MEFLLIILVIVGLVVAYNMNKTTEVKTYPRLTNAMFSAEGVISTVDAKRLFRKYMLDIGYFEKDEATEHTEYFAEAMRDRAIELQDDINYAKEALAEAKKEANDFTGLTKDEIVEAKADIPNYIQYAQDELAEAQAALSKFKADKRDFFIEYINQQTQEHH
ncbi:MAG: hypothetical protein Q8S71_03815 [Hydrogenophaga sp.]|nr:hypothetical protein [Hydrogenophaga sp.]